MKFFKTVLTFTLLMGALLAVSGRMEAQTAQTVQMPELVDVKLVDKTPSFPGGRNELTAFVEKTMVYPEEPKRNKTVGTIPVEFVVAADGTILNPKNIGDTEIDNRLIREAIRVIKAMPVWAPAEYNGQKVACKVVVPVTFAL